MIKPRLILCNGAEIEAAGNALKEKTIVRLESYGMKANVNIRLQDVSKVILKDLSPRLVDFLEIASYVYTADSAISRGVGWQDGNASEPWDRDFKFIIGVRDLDFWNAQEAKEAIASILEFLSDDRYTFEFQKLGQDRHFQQYFEFSENEEWPFREIDRVIMFSGGLDSLAGALETAAAGKNLVLVSHRPVAKLSKRQSQLFNALRLKSSVQMMHIPVWINKDRDFGREHTQRTRSFLYCALGAVVAQSIGAEGVRFFENGIVSLNWPIADEVVRARASRTTHPYVLQLLAELCGSITGREFMVDNPYIFKTKAEVVSSIRENSGEELIQLTCSCVRTGLFQSKTQWHCGTCSQCIDRRIAMLALGLEDNDPANDYVSDVFIGARKEGYERNMAVNYVRHAHELKSMSEEEIASKFNLQLSRAIRPFPRRAEAAQMFIEMHKRHAESVHKIFVDQLRMNANSLIDGSLDQSCMIATLAGMQHLETSWKRFSDRISDLLRNGVPMTCKTHKPENEKHLQEICTGILKSNDMVLTREFPFMQWSSSLTKPDWSFEALRLWIEAKYVKEGKNIYRITEEISSDITKYADSNRRILFIIYDPYHLVTDDKEFAAPIVERRNMGVEFIR